MLNIEELPNSPVPQRPHMYIDYEYLYYLYTILHNRMCWFITYPLIICDVNPICDVLTFVVVGLSVFKQHPQHRT